MAKRILVILAVIGMAMVFWPLVSADLDSNLTPLARGYLENGAQELGAANQVTSVIVTYRGLDTLGEVTVLFIATAAVGFLLKRRKERRIERRRASELLQTGARFLMPVIILFGVSIFVHGHLTPGGGFQGGVIIASAILLWMLADVSMTVNQTVLKAVESFSGFFYVGIGLAGLLFAAGFLDTRFLPLGELGQVLSAGAIPVIYSLIGLKVGSELTGILDNLRGGHA